MGQKTEGKFSRKEPRKIGFWCSLPICIFALLYCLPVGIVLVILRLHKKQMISKRAKNIGIITTLAVFVFFVFLVGLAESPDSTQQNDMQIVNNETEQPTESISQETEVPTTSYEESIANTVNEEMEPQINPYDQFFVDHERYNDELCGGYHISEYGIYFDVTAGIDAEENVEYVISVNTGEIVNGSYYIHIPSSEVSFTNRSCTVSFDIDAYYSDYNGSIVFDLQYGEYGETLFTLCADIPEIIDTNENFVEVICLTARAQEDTTTQTESTQAEYGDEAERCLEYATKLATQIPLKYIPISIIGVEVKCDYSLADYTFTTSLIIPKSGILGGMSSMGAALGGDISFNEDGAFDLAEDIYFDYFYPEGFYGITCVFEIQDLANDQYICGYFSGADVQDGLHDYAGSRDFVIENNILVEYLGKDTEIVIPEGVEVIDEEVFAFNENLKVVYLPSTIKEIRDGAFFYCDSLSEAYLQEGVQTIGYGAFYGTNLTRITIPSSITWIGAKSPDKYGAFDYCPSLKDVQYGGTMEKWHSLGLSVGENVTIHCIDGDIS